MHTRYEVWVCRNTAGIDHGPTLSARRSVLLTVLNTALALAQRTRTTLTNQVRLCDSHPPNPVWTITHTSPIRTHA